MSGYAHPRDDDGPRCGMADFDGLTPTARDRISRPEDRRLTTRLPGTAVVATVGKHAHILARGTENRIAAGASWATVAGPAPLATVGVRFRSSSDSLPLPAAVCAPSQAAVETGHRQGAGRALRGARLAWRGGRVAGRRLPRRRWPVSTAAPRPSTGRRRQRAEGRSGAAILRSGAAITLRGGVQPRLGPNGLECSALVWRSASTTGRPSERLIGTRWSQPPKETAAMGRSDGREHRSRSEDSRRIGVHIHVQGGLPLAGSELRIVALVDALAEVLPAVEQRLRADGVFCPRDQAVYGALRQVAIGIEEDAGVVTYALSLFRAEPTSRRSQARRAHLTETYGEILPPAPWEGDPEAA